MINEWSYDLDCENPDIYFACFEFVLDKLEQSKIDEIIERVDNYFDGQGLSDIQDILGSNKNSDKTVILVFWNLESEFYEGAQEECEIRGKEIEDYINELCQG